MPHRDPFISNGRYSPSTTRTAPRMQSGKQLRLPGARTWRPLGGWTSQRPVRKGFGFGFGSFCGDVLTQVPKPIFIAIRSEYSWIFSPDVLISWKFLYGVERGKEVDILFFYVVFFVFVLSFCAAIFHVKARSRVHEPSAWGQRCFPENGGVCGRVFMTFWGMFGVDFRRLLY